MCYPKLSLLIHGAARRHFRKLHWSEVCGGHSGNEKVCCPSSSSLLCGNIIPPMLHTRTSGTQSAQSCQLTT